MSSYCRIVSAAEKKQILSTSRIDFNKEDWGCYPPQSVIFLFDLASTREAFLDSVARAMFDANNLEQWYLYFDAMLETEPDQSGNWGGVVSRAIIELSDCQNVSWKKAHPLNP